MNSMVLSSCFLWSSWEAWHHRWWMLHHRPGLSAHQSWIEREQYYQERVYKKKTPNRIDKGNNCTTHCVPHGFALLQSSRATLPPCPGSRAGQTYVSADEPSASWQRVRRAVMHKKVGPHLLLTLKMLLSLSPTQALMSYNEPWHGGTVFHLPLHHAGISLP